MPWRVPRGTASGTHPRMGRAGMTSPAARPYDPAPGDARAAAGADGPGANAHGKSGLTMQKIIIAVLATVLVATCTLWGYVAWQGRTAPAPPVAAAPTAAAVAATPGAAPATAPPAGAAAGAATPMPDATAAAAAATDIAPPKQGGTRFTYEYVPPRNPALAEVYRFTREVDLLKRVPELVGVDGLFVMPRQLHVLAAECQQINAFYSASKAELVLCYELVEMLTTRGAAIAQQQQADVGGFSAEFLIANTRFIMLHELGHALIDLLDLSVTGREEDAADQLAASLMLQNSVTSEPASKVARDLRLAAMFFMMDAKEQYASQEFADEHAMGQQRFYNLMCMLYGSDPGRYVGLVTSGLLPESRSVRCQDESTQISKSWARLLTPHIAEDMRMTPEEAQRRLEEMRETQRESEQSPYVRGGDAQPPAPAPSPSPAPAPPPANLAPAYGSQGN